MAHDRKHEGGLVITAGDVDFGAAPFSLIDKVKIGTARPGYQWVGRKRGATLLGEPEIPNIEIEIPIRIRGADVDEILEAGGSLAMLAGEAESEAHRGGIEGEIQLEGATYASTIEIYAVILPDLEVTRGVILHRRLDTVVTLVCAPWHLAPSRIVAEGRKPAGVVGWDVPIEDVDGDMPGPAEIELENLSTVGVQYIEMGLQHRTADTAASMLLRPSTFDYSSPPLNGSYTAGTDEVHRLTPSGTVSGGSATWQWEGYSVVIPYNSGVAAAQALVDAAGLAGKVTVGGSALNAGFMSFTFVGEFAKTNVSASSVINALTGAGASVAATTHTAGVAGYVALAQLERRRSMFFRTAAQTDRGSYRLRALVLTNANAGDCHLAATVSVGDPRNGQTNDAVSIPVSGNPVWVDLGPANVDAVRGAGPHKWHIGISAWTIAETDRYCRVLAIKKIATENGLACAKVSQSVVFRAFLVEYRWVLKRERLHRNGRTRQRDCSHRAVRQRNSDQPRPRNRS
jgi:hypothetical protein